MIARVCTAKAYNDAGCAEELEKNIQLTLEEMSENGLFLKQINYSSSCCSDSHERVVFEKSAVLIFDREK